jgi:hypothetical protein
MNTRRLTKKYKNKSKSKKTRKSRRSKRSGRSRRRVLKGGVPSVRPSGASVRPSSGVVIRRTSGASVRHSSGSFRPSSSFRPSAAPPRQSASSIFKQPYTSHIDLFFNHLEEEEEEFEKTLCALYNLYNRLPRDKINEIMHSNSFKTRYERAFYFQKETTNIHGIKFYNSQPNKKYILFLRYIFKKVVDGGFIRCNGKRQDFVYSRDKSKIRILTVLKKFLGYLDTACVLTTSYSITKDRYDQISRREKTGVTKEEQAVYDIVSGIIYLQEDFPSLEHILYNMTLNNDNGSVASYNMNTTVLSRFINQTYKDFLKTTQKEDE